MKGLIGRMAVMLLASAILGIAAMTAGGAAAWFLLGCCLFLTLLGTLGSIWVAGDVQIERVIEQDSLRSGETLHVKGVVRLPFRFPFAYAIIRDVWLNARSQRLVQGAVLLLPLGKREVPFAYSIPCLSRGIYRLARVETAAGDMLHLSGYRTSQQEPSAAEVIVYPEARHEAELASRPGFREDPVFPAGIREYVEGDCARRIDWKSFARTGKLMTKLQDEEEGGMTCLVLDPCLDEDSFERVVAAAAGYVERRLGSGSGRLGLFCGTAIAEGRGDDGAKLMTKLAAVRRSGVSTFRLSVAAAADAAGREGTVVVVLGSLEQRVIDVVREIGAASVGLSILYASSKPVLSVREREAAENLLHGLSGFGFVPGSSSSNTAAEGVPVLG